MERRLAAWLVADRLQRVHACQVRILEVRQPGVDRHEPRDRAGLLVLPLARWQLWLTESNEVTQTTFRADNALALGFAHALSFGAEISSFEIGYSAQTEAAQTNGNTATSTLTDLLRQSENGRVTTAFVHDRGAP